jgi:membrane dipeptidase
VTQLLPMADCHSDLLLVVRHARERGQRDPFGDFWLPQLRAGGVVLQVLAVFVEPQHVGEGALRRSLLLVEEAHRIAEEHPGDVTICRTGAEVRAATSAGRIALVLALEGAEPIGSDLRLLDVFWRLGVRLLSLTWNRRTMLADGADERATGGGLTALGVEALAECERLGVVVDVSHLSDAGFADVARLSRRPFVASHSSCRALLDHPRNLTDEQLRQVAASGGFVGVNAFAPFLAARATASDYLRHVAHAVGLVGAEHVALGPDFSYDLVRRTDPVTDGLPGTSFLADLRRPADLAAFGALLAERLGAAAARQVAAGTALATLSTLP